jgi:hypothetical protein
VPLFVVAQCVGALVGVIVFSWLLKEQPSAKPLNPEAEL